MILETLRDISEFLKKLKIPYMIIGGLAVVQYGIPRFTQDIDVSIWLDPNDIKKIIEKIILKFQILVKNPEEFVRETWVLPIAHLKTNVRVDLIFSQTIFEKDAIGTARRIKIDNVIIKFIRPEDLIVQKLISGRRFDIEDAKSVMNVQMAKINYSYIEKKIKSFSKELSNSDILSQWDKLKK